MLNRAEEDYLKTIYELTIEQDAKLIKTSDLVNHFGFSEQTINEMVKKLTHKGFVEFIPYKGLHLTKKGEKEAVKMIRAHRLWEVFLTEKLGFNWTEVHKEAELFEHVSSDEVLKRLNEYLNYPQFCQHGNPIPTVDGKMEKTSRLTIMDLKLNDSFKIVRVIDKHELLTFLDSHNIRLNDVFTVTKIDNFLRVIEIKGKTNQVLSMNVAKMIFVEKG